MRVNTFFKVLLTGLWVFSADAKIPDLKLHPVFELKGPFPVLFVEGKTIAEVVYQENGSILLCRLHELDEEHDAEDIIKKSNLPVKYPSFKGMMHLIKECSHFPMDKNTTIIEDEIPASHATDWSSWAIWRGILPGTKWCGMGDIATSFEDLGAQLSVDTCCRSHDLCPVKLKSFGSGYGLINFSLYTKSHCECDHEFYNCLKDCKIQFANVVGNFYFNVLRTQCLKNRQSFVCIQNGTDSNGNQNCIRWDVDPNNKKMQMITPVIKY